MFLGKVKYLASNVFQNVCNGFLLDLRNFNEIFRKDVTYDNIKSHKKPGIHPLSRRYILKTTGSSNWPPSLLRIKFCFSILSIFYRIISICCFAIFTTDFFLLLLERKVSCCCFFKEVKRVFFSLIVGSRQYLIEFDEIFLTKVGV